MENYEINDKEEFLMLLEDMEKMARIDFEKFQNQPNLSDIILKFNILSQNANTLKFSKDEQIKAQNLWNSLTTQIKNHQKQSTVRTRDEQKLLLTKLKEVTNKWNEYSIDEKKALITKINQLQMNRNLFFQMTEEEKVEYRQLCDFIKNNTITESISQDEYNDIVTQYHK